VGKFDSGDDKRKPFFVLGCERGGKYVSTNKKLKFDQTRTRKCGCPFLLRDYYLASKVWRLSVVNGTHNHKLDKELEGHLEVGRLKPNEKGFLDEMTRNLVTPRNIISTLKDRDPENKTSAKQIYNARHRLVVEDRVEHLQDIFFAHSKFSPREKHTEVIVVHPTWASPVLTVLVRFSTKNAQIRTFCFASKT
ncbi:hypothetical protein L195_g032766, partial [Trifolium pratense]